METLKVIIADDEPLARKGLSLRLAQFPDIAIIDECKNGREVLSAIVEKEPDLVFLDIQMPGMSGFDVVQKLQAEQMPLIIFVTAYDQYAVEAFNVHAVDYILKPIDDDRLEEAIKRARDHLSIDGLVSEKQRLLELIISITGRTEKSISQLLKDHEGIKPYPEKLAIKDAGEVTLVETKDIDWVDAAGDYMCVHANDETHVMRSTMKDLESQLDPAIFQRVHRSTIVNLERVTRVCSHMNGEYFLVLSCGASIKMSRSYKDKVKHFF